MFFADLDDVWCERGGAFAWGEAHEGEDLRGAFFLRRFLLFLIALSCSGSGLLWQGNFWSKHPDAKL